MKIFSPLQGCDNFYQLVVYQNFVPPGLLKPLRGEILVNNNNDTNKVCRTKFFEFQLQQRLIQD